MYEPASQFNICLISTKEAQYKDKYLKGSHHHSVLEGGHGKLVFIVMFCNGHDNITAEFSCMLKPTLHCWTA